MLYSLAPIANAPPLLWLLWSIVPAIGLIKTWPVRKETYCQPVVNNPIFGAYSELLFLSFKLLFMYLNLPSLTGRLPDSDSLGGPAAFPDGYKTLARLHSSSTSTPLLPSQRNFESAPQPPKVPRALISASKYTQRLSFLLTILATFTWEFPLPGCNILHDFGR